MLIQDRIRLIIKSQNLTPSAFADQIGIKRSNLSHVLSGRNKPGLDFLAKVIEHYPNVNAAWLITGETLEGDFSAGSEKKAGTGIHVSEIPGEIEQITVFYKDGSFRNYLPNAQ